MAAGFFFEGGGRGAAVDTLLEVATTEDVPQLLLCPSGGGRTTVLRQFCAEAESRGLAVAQVTGDILMSPDGCLQLLCGQWSAGEIHDDVQAAVAGVRAAGRRPCAVVDDAHELGEQTRDTLLAACAAAGVPVVLAGDATLSQQLAAAQVWLAPFSEQDSADFIAGWLRARGRQRLPRRRAALRMHRQAGGLPAGLVAQLESGAGGNLAAGMPLPHLALALSALLLLAWLLWSPPAGQEPAAPVAVPLALPTESVAPGRTPSRTSSVAVPVTVDIESVPPVPAVSLAPPPEDGAPDAAAPATAVPVPAVPVPAAPAPAAGPPPMQASGGYSADEQWLLAQPPSRYVLQLFASSAEASVRQFAGAHPGVRVLRLLRDGSPWYVAVSGSHAGRDAARAAIEALPADVRALKPWPRSVQALQDELQRRP